jgi:predicted RNA-binding protein YlxR (DUF448 family)
MKPVRTCLGCRQRAAASSLLRCVAQDGEAVPDASGTLPGRGAWVHPTLECVDSSIRRRAFGRALKVADSLDTRKLRLHFATQAGNSSHQ